VTQFITIVARDNLKRKTRGEAETPHPSFPGADAEDRGMFTRIKRSFPRFTFRWGLFPLNFRHAVIIKVCTQLGSFETDLHSGRFHILYGDWLWALKVLEAQRGKGARRGGSGDRGSERSRVLQAVRRQ